MEAIGKENQNIHTKLNKRKSYSILSPVNQRTVDCNKSKNDRIISESTGLVKFSLSPNKKELEEKDGLLTPTKSRGKAGLPVYVPVNETIMEQNELSQGELMIQYASKQRQLIELEKQIETTRFEMAEISSKITKDVEKPITEMNTLTNLRKKASNVFQINLDLSPNRDNNPNMRNYVSKKASSIFQPSLNPAKSINSFGNYINKFQDQISQTQLTNPVLKNFVKDVKNKIDINENDKLKKFLASHQSEFDEFTNKTSKFVNGIICNISTNNRRPTNEDMANSSFNFEAVGDNVDDTDDLGRSISFSDDESNDGNPDFDEDCIVDIDDYNSSFEE